MSDDYKTMFDNSGTDELDKQVADHLARPTLVGKIKGQNKRKKKADSMSFAAELEAHGYVYFFLLVSSIFTGTLGFYMGLAPYKTPEGLYFNTDPMHVFLAIVYCLSFIAVTEGAFGLGKRLYFTREEKNDTQKYTMLAMMVLAGLSIAGTGIAGGLVIASNISFMTSFVEVPETAQRWVIVVIPILLSIYTFLVTPYHLSSDAAASERISREQIREREVDHNLRQRSITQIAEERLQEEELRLYLAMVQKGTISSAQATAAIKAGKTLGQLERELGRDLDGNKTIGTTNRMPQYALDVEDTVSPNGQDPTHPTR